MPEREIPVTSDSNGASPALSAEDPVISTLQQHLDEAAQTEGALQTQLSAASDRRKRLQRALDLLVGQTRQGRPPGSPKKRIRTKYSNLSQASLEVIRESVLQIAAQQDEFRQVDVRTLTPSISSGRTSLAFEAFRQEGFIRLARQDSNSKWYRLTPAAIAAMNKETK